MTHKLIGICRICNKKHNPPVCGTKLIEEKLKITVYNTICNLCLEKVDYMLVNQLMEKSEDKLPSRPNEEGKIIFLDAATNTENNLCNRTQETTLQIPETCVKEEESLNLDSDTLNKEKSQRFLTCEYCQKKFTHTGDLNKHRRKHTGERPYDCFVCNQKFSHSSNLARHQRLHSGTKRFFCPRKCGKSYSRKDKLTEHFSKHHSDY